MFLKWTFVTSGHTFDRRVAFDITPPTDGRASEATIYVELSRGRRSDQIVIMKPFSDNKEMKKRPENDLNAEID